MDHTKHQIQSNTTQEALETEAGCVGVTWQGTVRGYGGGWGWPSTTQHVASMQTQSQHAAAGW